MLVASPHSTDATVNVIDRRDHEALAAEIIAEPPEHRHRHHRRQQIRARDPRVVLEAVQFGDDRRQRRADDRLVERDQHVDEADAEHREKRVSERQGGIGLGHGRIVEWKAGWLKAPSAIRLF